MGMMSNEIAHREEGTMQDQFDVTLEDPDLMREVEMTTNLIIAASEADEHLTMEQIDRILEVRPVSQRHAD